MELALHLGMPSESLARSMTERELTAWANYRARHLLPLGRIEMYLAQIAFLIAKTMGGIKNAKLDDFLFKPPPDDDLPDNVSRIDLARQAFGFNPKKRKKGS